MTTLGDSTEEFSGCVAPKFEPVVQRLEAGIAGFTPHDLRRSNISDLLDEGVDLAVIARQVGHSSVQTTARYDRRGRRAQRVAAERLKVPFRN